MDNFNLKKYLGNNPLLKEEKISEIFGLFKSKDPSDKPLSKEEKIKDGEHTIRTFRKMGYDYANKVLKDKNLSSKDKWIKMKRIRFTIFDAIDPYTKGGKQPPSEIVSTRNDLQGDTAGLKSSWWDTIKPGVNDKYYDDYESVIWDTEEALSGIVTGKWTAGIDE